MSGVRMINRILVLCVMFVGIGGCEPASSPPKAPPVPGSGQYQGLTPDERQTFYHQSIGTQFIPYDWFVSVKNYSLIAPGKAGKPSPLPGYGDRLVDTVHHYGLIPDPKHPDHLPVGMTKADMADFKTGAKLNPPRIGFNCAFCHTGEFTYKGKPVRIEGGVSQQFNVRFLAAVIKSLSETLKDKVKFAAFAKEVLGREGKPVNPGNMMGLAGQVKQELLRLLALGSLDPLEWGFGRVDALGRGGNLIFSKLNPDNLRYANAPVKMTQIWGAWEYDWVQWNGSIQHPLARNIGQVIGVGADLFTNPDDHLTPKIDPKDPYRSSVDFKGLDTMEALVQKLTPPVWPSEFPPININRASKGRELYVQRCVHCHQDPEVLSKRPARTPQSLHVNMIPLGEIGTDMGQAENFWRRRADSGPLGKGRIEAGPAIALLTTEIMKRGGIKVKQGSNIWRAQIFCDSSTKPEEVKPEKCLGYMARPHKAIWATAPYLHNSSVPTLYDLLSPWEERPRCFEIGPKLEFDPEKVGFTVGPCDLADPGPNPLIVTDPFRFDTGRLGNSNRGHEFRATVRTVDGTPSQNKIPPEKCDLLHNPNPKDPEGSREKLGNGFEGIIGCGFTKDERMDLIEYLKTL